MRTNVRSEPAETTTPVRRWQQPKPRYQTVNGRTVPVYECRYCRDSGLVSLPKYRPEETDEELIGARGKSVLYGMPEQPRYAYLCPACRGETTPRLARWYRAMTVALQQQAEREQHRSTGVLAAEPERILKPMPSATPAATAAGVREEVRCGGCDFFWRSEACGKKPLPRKPAMGLPHLEIEGRWYPRMTATDGCTEGRVRT